MTSINGEPPLVDMSSDKTELPPASWRPATKEEVLGITPNALIDEAIEASEDNRPRYSTRRMRQEIERAKQQERERCAEHCIEIGFPDIAHDLRKLK